MDTNNISASIFAPGIISTGKELAIAFSPDSSVIYFSRRLEKLNKDPGKTAAIFWSSRDGDGWSPPKLAPYSGEYSTVDPAISPNGSRMYIMTTRPIVGDVARQDSDIWFLTHTGDGWSPDAWSAPIHLGPEVNSPDGRDGAPTVAMGGNLYFFSDRSGGHGSSDLYMSKYIGGVHQRSENLGPSINSDSWEAHPFIAEDESFLIFTSGRDGGFGDCDIYVSSAHDSSWSRPENIGPQINTSACEMLPVISPDGDYLFFTRVLEDGRSNIYRFPTDLLETIM